jgi:hypothetical protein
MNVKLSEWDATVLTFDWINPSKKQKVHIDKFYRRFSRLGSDIRKYVDELIDKGMSQEPQIKNEEELA